MAISFESYTVFDDMSSLQPSLTWKKLAKHVAADRIKQIANKMSLPEPFGHEVHCIKQDKRLDGLRYAVLVGFGAWLHGYWALGLFAGYLG